MKLNVDFARLQQDFQNLDPNDPGVWPTAPKIAVYVGLFIAVLAAAWWFDFKPSQEQLENVERQELTLREQWVQKKRQAVNLEALKVQLEEIDRQFGTLLRQLPNKAEMDDLLAEINQAGLGRGLDFELFKPGNEDVRDFYAQMPISIKLVGNYHDFGAFASDVGAMARVVTLGDLKIGPGGNGKLQLDAIAMTYRYLDEEELSAQRQAQQTPVRR